MSSSGFNVGEETDAAVRGVALDARESLHTLVSDTHPLGALKGLVAELQDAVRVETPHRNDATVRVWLEPT